MWLFKQLLGKSTPQRVEAETAAAPPFLATFPLELLINIFRNFSAEEINELMKEPFCKSFNDLNKEDIIWQELSRATWQAPPNYNGQGDWRSLHKLLTNHQLKISSKDLEKCIELARLHLHVPGIQTLAFSVLAELALDEETRFQIVHTGGVPVVLNAMRAHIHNAQIQEEACRSLVFLGRPLGGSEGKTFNGAETTLSNVSMIAQEGGLQLVLTAMKRHPDNVLVQAAACWALVNLSLIYSHKVQICNDGGIELVLSAMKNHPNNEELQYRACFVLVNLAIPDASKPIIVQNNGINLILQAMRNFPNHAVLLHRACLVLRNFCSHPEYCSMIRRSGAMDVIKEIIKTHPTVEDLNAVATTALSRIIGHE